MVYTKNLILVCTGRDTARAARLGLPVLHLCLGVTPAGALQRLQLPTAGAHCLLGLCDPPHDLTACRADRLAADLVFEAQRAGAPGVFADFEHDTPAGRRLLAAFDDALHEADIPFYVPLACGRFLSHAVLTTPTALSGGSLTAYISSLQGIYGAARIAAFLQPVSQDFTLPSASPNGKTLTQTERENRPDHDGLSSPLASGKSANTVCTPQPASWASLASSVEGSSNRTKCARPSLSV